MEQKRIAMMNKSSSPSASVGDPWIPRQWPRGMTIIILSALCVLSSELASADTAAQAYNPPWAGSLAWAANNALFNRPAGSFAYLDNNSVDSITLPWWQSRVAHPIYDYDAAKLPTGSVRLDSAVEADVTFHRLLPGWTKQSS